MTTRINRGEGQDGGRVRRGDHLPSHRYSRNTSTRGTALTEHLLNAGLLPAFSRCSVGVVPHVDVFLMYLWGGR